MSFFQVKNYADEFLAHFSGETDEMPEEEEIVIAYIAEEIQQFTSDFVLKNLSRELKGHPFSEFVAHLISKLGYKTRVSPEGPDGGIDIVAHKDELGFEPPIIKIQVKSSDGNIGEPEVSQLYGKVESNEFGLFVTLGGYTRQASRFAAGKSNLRLIDGEDIVNLIADYYENLDVRYNGIIPLKKVLVPESLGDL